MRIPISKEVFVVTAIEVLSRIFDYETFRPGQLEVIESLQAGDDVIATLPTGAGKSLCYQIPALMSEGLTVVITPLLSLMEDQVNNLKKRGVKRVAAINSFNTRDERQKIIASFSTLKLLYLSPEIIQESWMIDHLKSRTIAYVVVDEAHCVSQWGHEFRPDYLKISPVVHRLGQPTLLLLTATLTPDVKQDILKHFANFSFIEHIYPIDRENISFVVEKMASRQAKDQQLLQWATDFFVPSLVYFSSKKEAERLSHWLSAHLPHRNIAYYHSELDKKDRLLIQTQFIAGDLDLVCATSAFGMGVDKPDIRLIIHYHMPTQLESFIQEVGRAGRDGKHSVSATLLGPHDFQIPEHLIENELPDESVIDKLYQTLFSSESTSFDLMEWANALGLNEVNYRFIKNYLENKQIINDNKDINKTRIQPQLFTEWKIQIRKRQRFKRQKLMDIYQFLTTEDCLRQALYQPFQTVVRPSKWGCCSSCGFQLTDFTPTILEQSNLQLTWEEKLKQKLLPHRMTN